MAIAALQARCAWSVCSRGGTEKGHDFIAHVVFERALADKDLFGHDAVVVAQDLDHFARSVAFRIGSKPGDVAEKHRKHPFFPTQFQPIRRLEQLVDHQRRHVLPEGALDPFAFLFLGNIVIRGQGRIVEGKSQQRKDDVEPRPVIDEQPAGHDYMEGEQTDGETESLDGAHTRKGYSGQCA
jgi:hypothetical protein